MDISSNVKFYSLENKVLVVMEPKATFSFNGKLRIKVLYGTLEIYGSELLENSTFVHVYSPRGHSKVVIENVETQKELSKENLKLLLSREGITVDINTKLQNDIESYTSGLAIFILMSLENTLTNFLSTFYPVKLFPSIENSVNYSWTDKKKAEVTLQCNFYFDKYSCKQLIYDRQAIKFIKDKMLQRIADDKWSCSIIAGGKGVGKSTTVRFVINNILPATNVVLVDLDPGQTECTPAGCISFNVIKEPLLGPNFTHLITPYYQLFVGDVNISNCAIRYLECIKMLMDKLASCPTLSKLPVIINTIGFCQGIGWDIVIFVIKLFQPSLVVQIISQKKKNNFDEFLTKEVINVQTREGHKLCQADINWSKPCNYEFQTIESYAEYHVENATEMWNMEPYQKRELMMVAYLSKIVKNNKNILGEKFFSNSINAVVPYVIPFSSLYICLSRSLVPISRVFSVLNGNIVALCGVDENTLPPIKDSDSRNPVILIRQPLGTCYGFGIVRGVDMEKAELYIITALSKSVMQSVNCLMGCIPIPKTILKMDIPHTPYTGENATLPTSREHRRGYFRMKYQNKST
ncbi:polynucleotide 5'-hydroxyl-kinase NOL9 [Prorops nasuta]|uniref:polynucleotide 5'-hydroxyl-kinase NOL9 n=1 Tax=Prorops nasuta TaxID=863751 RepID=UPI0034CE0308